MSIMKFDLWWPAIKNDSVNNLTITKKKSIHFLVIKLLFVNGDHGKLSLIPSNGPSFRRVYICTTVVSFELMKKL